MLTDDPTAAALLAAICADPEDMEVRLVLADFLEERNGPGDADHAAWIRSGEVYADANIGAALAMTGQRSQGLLGVGGAVIRGGFVEEVELTCAKWLTHGPQLVRLAPLRVVRLTDRQPARSDGNGRGWWNKFSPLNDPDDVPAQLHQHLKPGQRDSQWWTWYDSPEAAHAALSAACLTWARGNP